MYIHAYLCVCIDIHNICICIFTYIHLCERDRARESERESESEREREIPLPITSVRIHHGNLDTCFKSTLIALTRRMSYCCTRRMSSCCYSTYVFLLLIDIYLIALTRHIFSQLGMPKVAGFWKLKLYVIYVTYVKLPGSEN